LFSAFPTVAASSSEDESDEGFDCELIRAAIVCAAVIVEVCMK
jgi:hypothetical protein